MLVPLLSLAMSAMSSNDVDMHMGSYLYRACQADIRLMDRSSPNPKEDFPPAMECVNYLEGFTAAAKVSQLICIGDTKLGTVVRVYVAYIEKNPKLMDVSKPAGALQALGDEYPCFAQPQR